MQLDGLLAEAQRLAAAGFSVIPVDSDKKPVGTWRKAQRERTPPDALKTAFAQPRVTGAAVVTGKVSGGLFVFDFDRDDEGKALDPFDLEAEFQDLWLELVADVIDPATIPRQRTGGGGVQFFVRCPEPCANKKLARVPANTQQGFIGVIETRGERGYALIPPSAHPSGGVYRMEHLDIADAPLVTTAQFEKLLECARALDRIGPDEAEEKRLVSAYKPPTPREGERDVIGVFNAAHSPVELLEARGYKRVGAKLLSPDSRSGNPGVSVLDGGRLIYSHHGDVLNDGHAHDAFDVFGLLEFEGDKRAAYRAAAEELGMWDEVPRRRPQEPGGSDPERPPPDLFAHPRTDYGNGERLHALHGHQFRYCHAFGFLVWDGRRWEVDENDAAMQRLALETARALFVAAARLPNGTDAERRDRDDWLKHARLCERSAALKNAVDLCRTIPGVTVRADQLDADPMRLTILNGTLDLRTQKLAPHNPDDLITKLAPVTHDAAAAAPIWDAFQHTISAGDADLIAFKRRAYGYSATGDTSEQVLFIPFGTGANGKSTELETVGSILGDYAGTAQFDTFVVRKSEGIRNDLAALVGARFVSASEGENQQRLAEGLVKQLTGDDTLKVRFLHREYFSFRPTFKLWLATNKKPLIRGTDHGIWRRVRLIPYAVTIAPEQRDKGLRRKLEAERSGILNWLLAGIREWQAHGLGDAEAVTKATEEYRRESDVLAEFITARCATGEQYSARAGDLYTAYETWCSENGEKAFSSTLFGRLLGERGFGTSQRREGAKVVKARTGLCLTENTGKVNV